MRLPTSTNVRAKWGKAPPASADLVVHSGAVSRAHWRDRFPDAAIALEALKTKGNELRLDATLWRNGSRVVHVAQVRGGSPRLSRLQFLREAAGLAARHARKHALGTVALLVPEGDGVSVTQAAEALVTGFLLASFRYAEYRGGKDDEAAVELVLVCDANVSEAVTQGQVIAEAQNLARTIASRPGNDINPLTLATLCQQLAREVGLKYRVLDEKQLEKLGMGGLLAVGMGAQATPPRLIVLEHAPTRRQSGSARPPVLLVGKSVTFDTGGISIKPSDRMGRMVFDKCGGMTVLGVMVALARLKWPVRVVGLLPAAENHISERAYRPGDILRMYNGVTVEVTNTDAEGRLVLGDAMSWGIKTYQPSVCVDVATLTGGVSVALGRTMAGVMGNDQGLIDGLVAAGKEQGEKMWQLPLPEEPREMMRSEFADMVNSAGRDAHPLQGAAFLSQFLDKEGKIPWAHLDIAGVADTDKNTALMSKGATGWGVRMLLQWLKDRA